MTKLYIVPSGSVDIELHEVPVISVDSSQWMLRRDVPIVGGIELSEAQALVVLQSSAWRTSGVEG